MAFQPCPDDDPKVQTADWPVLTIGQMDVMLREIKEAYHASIPIGSTTRCNFLETPSASGAHMG